MINLAFIMFLIVLMMVVSLATAIFIEAVKKIVSEESIKQAFKSLEIFSLIFTLIIAIIVFLVFLLFTIKTPLVALEILKLVVAGILFIFACGCGSQIGYDKVIKTIKQIIELLTASKIGV